MKDVTGTEQPAGFGEETNVEIPAERRERSVMTQSDAFNKTTRMKHLFNEIHLSFRNYHIFEEAFAAKRAMDVDKIPKAKDTPILVMGSGPSFNRVGPLLSKWKGDIICSTSQATTCAYWGHDPTYILALDPDSQWNEIPVEGAWEGRETMLLTHPAVSNDLIKNWPNRIGLFRKCEPQTPFYANAQKIGYSIIRRYYDKNSYLVQMNITAYIPTEIVMLGCALNAQIFLAELMGYKTMYLCGADFGYPDNISRFNKWDYLPASFRWEESKGTPIDTKHRNLIMGENGVLTEYIMLFYRKNFASAWRLQRQNIINCSTGIISDMPYADIEDVVAQQGKLGGNVKGISRNEVILRSEGYMAQHQTFVIRFQNGIQFTEFEKGVVQILPYLKKMEEVGVKDLAYNETVKSIKKLARAGYLKDEEKKEVLNWEYRRKDIEVNKESEGKMRMPDIRQHNIQVIHEKPPEPLEPPKPSGPQEQEETTPNIIVNEEKLDKDGLYERKKLDIVEGTIGEVAEKDAKKVYIHLDRDEVDPLLEREQKELDEVQAACATAFVNGVKDEKSKETST